MNARGIPSPSRDCRPAAPPSGWARAARRPAAFTLIELLVVLSIIGIIAALSMPAIKSWNKSNVTTSANRQLLDDLALARQSAISMRTPVYMVFLPPSIGDSSQFNPSLLANSGDRQTFTNLLAGQYASYALFTARQVGEQPGRSSPRYLTAWKTLPQGSFFSTNKFASTYPPPNPFFRVNGVQVFTNYLVCPFPSARSPLSLPLPFIAFDARGRLTTGSADLKSDEILPLARGSVFAPHDANKHALQGLPYILESPAGSSVSVSNHIVVNALTGRAHVETQQIP